MTNKKKSVKIAILANNRASFVLPMAQGLKRMLSKIQVKSQIFYEGNDLLESFSKSKPFSDRGIAHGLKQTSLLLKLREFDVIVVVINLPKAFDRVLSGIELIRKFLPEKIIVNYDLHYLSTCANWAVYLNKGGRYAERLVDPKDYYGLARYDWYLMASISGERPIIGENHPYSLIGIDLNDGTLIPGEKEKFIVLVDFERPEYLKERAVQIRALEKTNTNYTVLSGRYSMAQIRKIYSQCSMYFLAFKESFGLPICEHQACGNYIITPHSHWCAAHWLKDVHHPGVGETSPNFIVYDNDEDKLMEAIETLKSNYDSKVVFDNFKQYHPQLFEGDLKALEEFIEMVKSGKINSISHKSYSDIKTYSNLHDKYVDAEPRTSCYIRLNP